jgi:hypothetical protein
MSVPKVAAAHCEFRTEGGRRTELCSSSSGGGLRTMTGVTPRIYKSFLRQLGECRRRDGRRAASSPRGISQLGWMTWRACSLTLDRLMQGPHDPGQQRHNFEVDPPQPDDGAAGQYEAAEPTWVSSRPSVDRRLCDPNVLSAEKTSHMCFASAGVVPDLISFLEGRAHRPDAGSAIRGFLPCQTATMSIQMA